MIDPAPKIDGDLSDACWLTATRIAHFYHLESGTHAAEPTRGRIAYDDKSVYVAFDCKDSQPESIRAQQRKRGGNMDEDDSVSLILDPFSESRWAALSHFKVNAIGTQWHSVQSSETGKTEWIGDWDAAVKRNPDGYSVEMRIPFAILKYDLRNPKIGLALVRTHARLDQEWWAPDTGKNNDLTKLYFWEGIRPPACRTRPVTLLYSLVGTGSGDVPNRVGMDIKHFLTPSLTGLLAINPDFRNIEQEVDSVDFTYTERELPDNRPLFREGSQYFPGPTLYYTRRIGKTDTGAKLVGLVGDYKLALLTARRFGHESYTIGQIGRQFGRNGDLSVWLSSTLSEVEGTDNLASNTTIWYKWRHTKDRFTSVGYSHSIADSAAGNGHGGWQRFAAHTENGARKPNFSIRRYIIDDDYDPYLGITFEKGIRQWQPSLFLWDSPESGAISYWNVGLDCKFTDHLDGSRYYNSVAPYAYVGWRNGRSADLSYSDSDRPPNHDRFWTAGYGWGQKDLYRAGNVDFAFGKLVGGDYLYGSLKQGIRLSNRLSAQLWTDYRKIAEPSTEAGTFRQTVVSAAYDISPERGIVGRWIRREGRSNVYFAYRQRVRAGLDAYLIYGDPNAEETSDALLLKLIRPL